ncbi:MAG: hypothetical protein KDH09_10100 [Chrysiogenetes bacterium]|nr:hypothetical protein [Chrysiogenetes bacterium]
MKRSLRLFGAAALAAALSVAGLQACGSDTIGLSLGEVDGPTAMELAQVLNGNCTENCNGTIPEPAPLGVKVAPPPEGPVDDDLDALILSLYQASADNPSLGEMEMKVGETLNDLYPEGLDPDQEIVFGPASGYASLDDACNDGTGVLTGTFFYRLAGASMGASAKGGFDADFLYFRLNTSLTMVDCQIIGDLTGAGNEIVTVTGSVTSQWEEDETDFSFTMKGSVRLNPGAVDPGGPAPTLIWGYDVPVTVDFKIADTKTVGTAVLSGGICYDGTTVTEAGCEGTFVSAEYISSLFD